MSAPRIARLLGVLVASGLALGFGRSAAADTTIDFEQFAAGTVLTNQYADAGGAGQGVVFGPLPAGSGVGEGLKPVVRTPPAGQAQSGTRVADVATCFACEFFTPRTTGTFTVPRVQVSVRVGYLGESAICTAVDPTASGCAVVSLRTFDRNGSLVAQASVRVTRGAGVHSLLSVTAASATIVGFELSGRSSIDDSKPIAVDDLTFGVPPPPSPPDFTLNPAATKVLVEQGKTVTDAITIGRLNGSSGPISFKAEGLPAGVTATFAPNPATGSQTVVMLKAEPAAPAATGTVRITASPLAASAGPGAHAFDLGLTVQPICKHVSTRTGVEAGLLDALQAGYKCIYVEDRAEIDLSPGDAVAIPEGVTLMGGRSPTVPGGLLHMPQRVEGKVAMLTLGSNTRITGLRLRGYNHLDTKDRDDPTTGIVVGGSDRVVIENNEIFDWPAAGVEVRDTPARTRATPRITRNYIHHNVQCNLGYGVVVGDEGSARIDRNVFDYNRHDIAGSGGPGQSYVAELNFVLTSGPTCGGHYNQHFDMHGEHGGYGGTAGDLMLIQRNTIRGAQSYAFNGRLTRPAFELRGTPRDKAFFTRNAVVHSTGLKQSGAFGKTISSSGAVRTEGVSATVLLLNRKLVIANNKTCVDTAKDLAVGDFNGDHRADVFQSVGTLWAWSPSGSREWHFLNGSTVRLGELGLGDFDGDGKTDVFTSSGGRWFVSAGGTGTATQLPAGSNIEVKRFRFGDFDGDKKTDVFRANGSQFFLSSGGATAWKPLAPSRLSIGDLRFGDFDGDGKTDVFSLANSQWSVSFGGTTQWRRLNRRLSSNLGSLVFADFNGDRKTDVARTKNGRWEVSFGGATAWQTLQFARSEPLSVGMLFGDFNGDGRTDVLQHGRQRATPSIACAAIRSGDPRFESFADWRLSPGGSSKPARWSFGNMR